MWTSTVRFSGALLEEDVARPNRIQALLAAEHPPRMLEQVTEQPVLGEPRSHLALPSRHPLAHQIHHHAALLEALLGAAGLGAP